MVRSSSLAVFSLSHNQRSNIAPSSRYCIFLGDDGPDQVCLLPKAQTEQVVCCRAHPWKHLLHSLLCSVQLWGWTFAHDLLSWMSTISFSAALQWGIPYIQDTSHILVIACLSSWSNILVCWSHSPSRCMIAWHHWCWHQHCLRCDSAIPLPPWFSSLMKVINGVTYDALQISGLNKNKYSSCHLNGCGLRQTACIIPDHPGLCERSDQVSGSLCNLKFHLCGWSEVLTASLNGELQRWYKLISNESSF